MLSFGGAPEVPASAVVREWPLVRLAPGLGVPFSGSMSRRISSRGFVGTCPGMVTSRHLATRASLSTRHD
jgi:hypothetical protein